MCRTSIKTLRKDLSWCVKQRGKFASFVNKERPNLLAITFILLFLNYLPSHLTGKIDAESGKSKEFFYIFVRYRTDDLRFYL
jgi:hypothetical protein